MIHLQDHLVILLKRRRKKERIVEIINISE